MFFRWSKIGTLLLDSTKKLLSKMLTRVWILYFFDYAYQVAAKVLTKVWIISSFVSTILTKLLTKLLISFNLARCFSLQCTAWWVGRLRFLKILRF